VKRGGVPPRLPRSVSSTRRHAAGTRSCRELVVVSGHIECEPRCKFKMGGIIRRECVRPSEVQDFGPLSWHQQARAGGRNLLAGIAFLSSVREKRARHRGGYMRDWHTSSRKKRILSGKPQAISWHCKQESFGIELSLVPSGFTASLARLDIAAGHSDQKLVGSKGKSQCHLQLANDWVGQ
jgi:hypothetical protein